MYFRALCLWLQRAGIAWRRKSTPEHVGHSEARAWQEFQQTLINVQNCCLMLFLTWNPQIDLCYSQSDYCALIQSKTLCQRKLLELIFCGKEINFIVFEIIITTVCAVASCEKLTTDKRATEQLKQGSFHKQASRYVVRHFQAKVSVHFNSPCLIVLVDIVNWFWKHLKAV